MAIKYIDIYHSKALQKLPKIGIFGLKSNHLATLLLGRRRYHATGVVKKFSYICMYYCCSIVPAFGVVGREIESRQGLYRSFLSIAYTSN
jgi:hypothetical protein